MPDYSDMTERAQKLRKNATKEENKLWYQYLHNLKPQWRRQHVIGNYILDFYCRKLKLAIELDGSQHYSDEGMAYDSARTEFLHSKGIKVLRYTNTDVDRRFDLVCDAIMNEIKERLDAFDLIDSGEGR
jgi:very-short-patch-repair endonuclease